MTQRTLKMIRCGVLLVCMSVCLPGYTYAEDSRMGTLLQRAGRSVERFWAEVASFDCIETLRQEKIDKKGKVEYRQDSVFDYLAIAGKQDEDLTIEELRVPQKVAPNKPNQPSLLSTNGFPTLLLVFHPLHQPNYKFWLESEEGKGEWLVRFEHIPGTRSTSALMVRDRIYPLDFRGTARIDYESGTVLSIRAGLMAPMKSINIEDFRIEVDYAQQSFSPDPARWLPSKAVIEVQTALQHWRNTHHYSQYKRFRVQTLERTAN